MKFKGIKKIAKVEKGKSEVKHKNTEEKKILNHLSDRQVHALRAELKHNKKKGIGHYSPNIFRFITEPRFWISVFTAFFILCLIVILFLTVRQVQELRSVVNKRKQVESLLDKWERIIATHPGYRDGYMEAAAIEYQLGDDNKTRFYIRRALELDPGYKPASRMLAALN